MTDLAGTVFFLWTSGKVAFPQALLDRIPA